MEESSRTCIICKESADSGRNLVANPEKIQDLVDCCNRRVTLGQLQYREIADYLSQLDEKDLGSVYYHSECRREVINKSKIERLVPKRDRSASSGAGRPSKVSSCDRPKRTKTQFKAEVCMFKGCSFCKLEPNEPLHKVMTDSMGAKLLHLKEATNSDEIRACVADLESDGDAAALEKHYHKKCMRFAERTLESHDSEIHAEGLSGSVCDEILIQCVENAVIKKEPLNMNQVVETYVSLLKTVSSGHTRLRNLSQKSKTTDHQKASPGSICQTYSSE